MTPHKLSEGCLEWWMVICVVFGSGGWFELVFYVLSCWMVYLCFELVDVIDIRWYIILYLIHILYYILLLYTHLPFLLILLISSQYSFYTCRYLHILIYIIQFYLPLLSFPIYLLIFLISNNSTPHKLSEGCLEWCSFEVCGIGLCFDPARSIGVDVSSGVVLFVWCWSLSWCDVLSLC